MKQKTGARQSRARRRRAYGARSSSLPPGSRVDTAGRIILPLIIGATVLVLLFVGPSRPGHAGGPLPEAAVPSGTPINAVDPSSGKPVSEGVNSVYKGYTIAHCCENSRATWEELPEKKKDGSIRRFIRAS